MGLDAVQALDRQGSCTSCANLVAALLRGNGIPARILAGYPTYLGHRLADTLPPFLRGCLVGTARRLLPISMGNVGADYLLSTEGLPAESEECFLERVRREDYSAADLYVELLAAQDALPAAFAETSEPDVDTTQVKAWSEACTGLKCEGLSIGFWNSVRITIPSVIVSIAIASVNGYALTSVKRQGVIAKAIGATASVNLVLNWFLIPQYGEFGAVAATMISEVLLLGITFARIPPDLRRFPTVAMVKSLAVVGVMAAVVYYLQSVGSRLLVTVAVGAVVYAVGLVVVRYFDPVEIDRLKRAGKRGNGGS